MDTEYAHVLIVEDTDAVREVFARQLEVLGVKADVAANGAEALGMFVKRPYHFVVTDFSMPHMNGLELVTRFRRIEADRMRPDRTIYVLLSADDKRLDAVGAGFDDVLLKPVSLSGLRQLMIKWKVPVLISGQNSASGPIDDTPLDLDVIREQMGDIDDIALAMLARFPEMMAPILDKLLQALEKKISYRRLYMPIRLKGQRVRQGRYVSAGSLMDFRPAPSLARVSCNNKR